MEGCRLKVAIPDVQNVSLRFLTSEKLPAEGLEPTLPKEHDFESCASANSATPAFLLLKDTRSSPEKTTVLFGGLKQKSFAPAHYRAVRSAQS
jgi:hypothetical protein